MSHGPDPWQQTAWDWRAAGNFVFGGAGSGLIVFTALAEALGSATTLPFACGAALVALGLFCVSLEIGRPLRALNVFRQPRRSWMSREAIVATLLLPFALAAALSVPGCAAAAALLALAFVYCQARILQAARGIPAWRVPQLVPLIVTTGLAEGGGLFLAIGVVHGGAAAPLLLLAGVLVLARWTAWLVYRRALVGNAGGRAIAALEGAALLLQWAGTLAPLLLLAIGLVLALATGCSLAAAAPASAIALAGVAALVPGAWLKFVLVTRAAFNQGYALASLPVRGVPRRAQPSRHRSASPSPASPPEREVAS